MDESILILAAERFGINPVTLKPLTGGHFSQVYEFSREGKACVLRIIPPNDEIIMDAVRATQAWMIYLSEHGAPVSRPLLSAGNRFVEVVAAGGGTYRIVAAEKARGTLAEEIPPDNWDFGLISALGCAIGRMHALAKGYIPGDKTFVRPHWDQIGNCFNSGICQVSFYPTVQSKRDEALDRVRSFRMNSDNYGLIHADLHSANFFVDLRDGSVSFFDFDDCCYGWYVMDTAMVLFDLAVVLSRQDIDKFTNRFLGWYLQGYTAEKSLDPDWVFQVPTFLKLLETSMFLELVEQYDPDDHVSWVGKFMSGRREIIEAGRPYLSLDLENLSKTLY